MLEERWNSNYQTQFSFGTTKNYKSIHSSAALKEDKVGVCKEDKTRQKYPNKSITGPTAKVGFVTTKLSPYLCQILSKDILDDLGLYRPWAYLDNAYLRVVSQLSPQRIKESLEDKSTVKSSFPVFLQGLADDILSYKFIL